MEICHLRPTKACDCHFQVIPGCQTRLRAVVQLWVIFGTVLFTKTVRPEIIHGETTL